MTREAARVMPENCYTRLSALKISWMEWRYLYDVGDSIKLNAESLIKLVEIFFAVRLPGKPTLILT